MQDNFILEDAATIAHRLGDVAHELSGKRMLFTGGRGFLGRYFVEVFHYLNENVLAKPLQVTLIDNLITAGKEGAAFTDRANVTFIQHDICQPFMPEDTFDYVVHAAGIASPYYYRAYPMETLNVAVAGTTHMLDLARRDGAKFTFFSSSEIYGDPDAKHVPMQESYRGNVSCQGPRACYDESKRLGETLCWIYHEYHGVHTNTIRPFNVFGPGMQETDYRVLPNFASRIIGGLPLKVYGSGQQTRTFCYLTDAIEGFLRVILKGVPGEAYNIGTPKPEVSVLDVVQTIEKVMGKSLDYEVIEYPDSYPADEPMRRCPDIRKARTQLNYHPEVTLEEGLARFMSWASAHYTGEQ